MPRAPRGNREEKERFWTAHAEEWRRSGLSKKRYCGEQGLPVNTFSRWLRRLMEAGTTSIPCVEFVPLGSMRPAASVPIVVVVGGGRYRVELTEGFRADTLHEIIDVLEVR
jgi:hypothetical protein